MVRIVAMAGALKGFASSGVHHQVR